jgi:hypothetical protein
VPHGFVTVRSRWLLLYPVLIAVAVPVALIGYALLLGASGVRLLVFTVCVALLFGPRVLMAVGELLGSSPALTADGVRLRSRPWSRLDLVPWFGDPDAVDRVLRSAPVPARPAGRRETRPGAVRPPAGPVGRFRRVRDRH